MPAPSAWRTAALRSTSCSERAEGTPRAAPELPHTMSARGSMPADAPEPEEEDRESTGCRQCGSPYRPPQWGREYLCGACGRPLQRRRRRRWHVPLPLICIGLLVGLTAVVGRVGADRTAAFAARPAAETAAARVPLPQRLHEQVRERLRWLALDLREAPDHPLLLSETASAYVYLAALDRRDPEACAR